MRINAQNKMYCAEYSYLHTYLNNNLMRKYMFLKPIKHNLQTYKFNSIVTVDQNLNQISTITEQELF